MKAFTRSKGLPITINQSFTEVEDLNLCAGLDSDTVLDILQPGLNNNCNIVLKLPNVSRSSPYIRSRKLRLKILASSWKQRQRTKAIS